jgi:hypothetical protein
MPSLAPDGAVFAGVGGAFSAGGAGLGASALGGAWLAGVGAGFGAGAGAGVVCGASVGVVVVATGAGAGAGALTVNVVFARSPLPNIITSRRWRPGASSWKVTCVEPERVKWPSST